MTITDVSANEVGQSEAGVLIVGTGVSTSAGGDPVRQARAAETAGYDFVSASDHPVGTHPTREVLTMLTWIAARTERIAVATRVLGTPFRRPAMVAKSAESLQRLSGGRLILGLGAGHVDDEIVALGGRSLAPGRKVAGLADAITIVRGAWDGGEVTYDGVEHQVHGLRMSPAAAIPIPIWLGTYGPRALMVTGRSADGWIPSLGAAAARDLPSMLARIRSASIDAGREADAVRAVLNVALRLDPAARSDEESIAGSAVDIVEQLHEYVTNGFRGFNLVPAAGQEAAVAAEILPALRAFDVGEPIA